MRTTIPALTIWQPWASLIVAGAKPYEFRRYAAPRSLRGHLIAIHAGARTARKPEMTELWVRLLYDAGRGTGLDPAIALPLLRAWISDSETLPHASVIGVARLGEPMLSAERPDLFADGDSGRIHEHVWAWPLTEIRPLVPIVPFRGGQGFWRFPRPCMAEAAA